MYPLFVYYILHTMSTVFAKLVTAFEKETCLIPNEIKEHLDYNVCYVGVYENDSVLNLYIQLGTGRMSPNSLYKKLSYLGNIVNTPSIFTCFEGVLVDEVGVFNKRGGKKTLVSINIQRPSTPKSILPYDKTSLERLARAYNTYMNRKIKAQEQNENQVHENTVAPLYAGHGGVWGISGWIPVPDVKGIRKKIKPIELTLLSEEQGGKCAYCETSVSFGKMSNADADHIIPLSLGGNCSMGNIQILCTVCHRRKTSLESRKIRRRIKDIRVFENI